MTVSLLIGQRGVFASSHQQGAWLLSDTNISCRFMQNSEASSTVNAAVRTRDPGPYSAVPRPERTGNRAEGVTGAPRPQQRSSAGAMETDGDQQRASTNGSAASGTSSRPSAMNSMSLYERQAVQVSPPSKSVVHLL
uniref:Uncharacterized protein n=1 Tax=Knipowitschia caucasica TaxID=637954 RepID=A0AAV2K6D5_KNICA